MAKQDCSMEMSGFHKAEVTLDKAAQDEMHSRRDAGRTRLDTGLSAKGQPLPVNKVSQGSYAMRTMVKDGNCDYDIDDGIYFRRADLKDNDGEELSPWAARQRVAKALRRDERLANDAENLTNCVRQYYPAGYHIDMPVYRLTDTKDARGNAFTVCELASGDNWIVSDGRAVTKWFKDIVGNLNRNESDGSQLRRLVKLTKKFARRQPSWKTKTTSGIALTKLVTEVFVRRDNRDDEALHETWKKLKTRLDESTAILHPVTVDNPRLAEEGNAKVLFFKECLADALATLAVLDDDEQTKKRACRAWDSVFNTNYFSDSYDEATKKAGSLASGSLLRVPVASAALSFPDRPVTPNKPAGFA